MRPDEREDGVDDHVDEELRFHFEERVEELLAAGMSPDEAGRRVQAEFGDVALIRRRLVEIDRRIHRRRRRREGWLLFAGEWRHALRRIARAPGFAVATVATLSLGLGAVAAVFTLLDGVVLRALPYPESTRLVRLMHDVPGVGPETRWGVSPGQFLFLERETKSFDAMGLYRLISAPLMAGDGAQAEYGRVANVGAGVADVIGATTVLGRPLQRRDNLAGNQTVVVLSHSFWARQLGADPGVIGRTLRIGGEPYEIVGVLAPTVRMPEEVAAGDGARVDVWAPLRLDPTDTPRNYHVFSAIARLAPGVTEAAALTELTRLYPRLVDELPTAYTDNFMRSTGFAPVLVTLRDDVIGGAARLLWILFGAAGLVLVITCANVANLFLVRMDGRRRETAVRSVLGASRADLARHFFAESLLLSLLSGIGALGVAAAAVLLVRQASPAGLTRLPDVHVGSGSVLFTLGTSVVVGLLFGLLPLLRRSAEGAILAEAGRGSTATRQRLALRGALVAAQVGLCFVLLVGGSLLVRSFRALSTIEPGFEPGGVLMFRVVLPQDTYGEYPAATAFYRQLTDRLSALPGVRSVGMGTWVPLGGAEGCTSVRAEGREGDVCVPNADVAPGYFGTLGLPVSGREAEWSEITAGARVAVVSHALAQRLWPGEDPVGRRVRAGGESEYHTVVGVAGDVGAERLTDPPVETLFLPIAPAQQGRQPALNMAVLVRTDATDPLALLPAAREALAAIDPRVPLTRPGTLADVVSGSMAQLSFLSILLMVAAGMALVVGAVGVHGVVAYTVAQRRAEIGVRIALGARPQAVRRLVLAGTLRVALLGIVLGALCAIPLAGTLRSWLFGVSPTDAGTLVAVGTFLLILTLVAGDLPARRILRLDAVEALRVS